MRYYIALVHKDRDSDFGVSFPDLPGCVTAGATLDEAANMAVEALAGHIECMAEDGLAVPEPSNIEAIMAEPENRDGIPVLVPAPAPKGRAVRLSITLPEDVLRQIDTFAEREGYTRSGLLAHAAKKLTGGRPSIGEKRGLIMEGSSTRAGAPSGAGSSKKRSSSKGRGMHRGHDRPRSSSKTRRIRGASQQGQRE